MRSLSAKELLDVWESGLSQTSLQRTLALIAAASPELEFHAITQLSVGARDARLLQLREWMFGSRLLNTAQCPHCEERVEWEGVTSELHMQSTDNHSLTERYNMVIDDYKVSFRLPTSMDIDAALSELKGESSKRDSTVGAQMLLKRCVISANCNEKVCDVMELPQTVLDALGREIEQLDPQSDIWMALTCPRCSHQWRVQFDIASYLWREINSWAERTLLAIHHLASAYGWSESEILKLSPTRRQLYLEMARR